MKNVMIAVLGLLVFGCNEGQDKTTLEGVPSELGSSEQKLIHVGSFDPQQKWGVYYEQGPLKQVIPEFGNTTTPFGAYVIWEGNNFALVAAFGSITVDLLADDASTFPAANPAQPIMYEYGEEADCDWQPLRLTCDSPATALFTPPGVGPVVIPSLEWTMTRYPGDPFFVFHSAIPGESVDAFNYPVTGAECEAAVERIVDFFDSRDVVFENMELDVEELCD